MKTLNDLSEEMRKHTQDANFDTLAHLAKNALQITLDVHDDDDLPIGISKFGGYPDLPAGIAWFRKNTGIPLSFLAQVNFAETSPFDLDNILPKNGMLYFFCDCSINGIPHGLDSADSDGWKVYFYDGDSAALSRRNIPEYFEEGNNGIVFGAARMIFEAALELPSPKNDLDMPDDNDLQDQYREWLEDQRDDLTNKLLGHAVPIQRGMDPGCEYVAQTMHYRIKADYAIAKSNIARWNLLMQVDSNEDIGMVWGDMGQLSLWITDEDLAARNFENSRLILQGG